MPEGNIVDREGRPTTEPGDFYAGGALPFGGHWEADSAYSPNSLAADWRKWILRTMTARGA